MSVTIKPKQALGFLPARNCICNSPYCQPILTTDSLMLQGTVDEASDINMIADGGFSGSTNWTLDAGWTISGGKLHGINVGIGDEAVTVASVGYEVGKVYFIKISVTVISGSTAGTGWIVVTNGTYLDLPDTATPGDGCPRSVTATWIYSPSAIGTDNLFFACNDSNLVFDIDYVEVSELSNVGVAIYSGDTLVDNNTSFTGDNFLNYYFQGTLFMDNGTIVGGVTNIFYESVTGVTAMWELFIDTWDSITSETGCLTARFYDTYYTANQILNGTFISNLDDWTEDVTTDWSWNIGEYAEYTWSGFTQGILYQTVNLPGGAIYVFGWTNLGDIRVRMSINGATPVIIGTYVSGTYTEAIDLSEYSGNVSVKVMFGENPSYHANIVLDAVTIIGQPDLRNVTNCLNIQTSQPCTILMYATNSDNAFGLDYTSGNLQHWLRVYGKIKYSDYPEEAEVFKFSDNSSQIMFASSEKQFEVIIGDAPEQIHDCISILRLHDVFEIDDTAYVRSGNYDLNRRRTSDNSQAVFAVKEQVGVSSNYSCQ